MSISKIPHRLYLTEEQMPRQWFNLRAVMPQQPDPLLDPATLRPLGVSDLAPIFCEELARQELDGVTEYVDIPEPIREVYKMFRPSPLIRAYALEKALGTPARIYYKFEGNNTSGSHKLNSAVAQAYYAKKQGLAGVTTETGAGQWGTALSEACAYFGLSCDVYMVKCSYEQKPFRKAVMGVFDAAVTASPSNTTAVGRKLLAENPGTTGSLGCAISEAVEAALASGGTKRYVLGSGFIPSANHAGGLRYHGMSPILSKLYHDGLMEAVAYEQSKVFEAAVFFAKHETILPAPESAHAIRGAMDEALRCKETGEAKTILFGLTGTGYFDMTAYESYLAGRMTDTVPTDADLARGFASLPDIPQNRAARA